MALTVPISADTEAKLRVKALAAGVDVVTFASRTLERAASRTALADVLAPLRAQFEESGMTDDELAELLEEVKHEARAEERARRAS